MPNNEWLADALCAEVGGDIFYPEIGESSRPAKSICAACPVIAECLQFALANNITVGIYGGTTPNQRRAMRPAA